MFDRGRGYLIHHGMCRDGWREKPFCCPPPALAHLCDEGEIERAVCDELAPAVDAVEALLTGN